MRKPKALDWSLPASCGGARSPSGPGIQKENLGPAGLPGRLSAATTSVSSLIPCSLLLWEAVEDSLSLESVLAAPLLQLRDQPGSSLPFPRTVQVFSNSCAQPLLSACGELCKCPSNYGSNTIWRLRTMALETTVPREHRFSTVHRGGNMAPP